MPKVKDFGVLRKGELISKNVTSVALQQPKKNSIRPTENTTKHDLKSNLFDVLFYFIDKLLSVRYTTSIYLLALFIPYAKSR